MDDDDLIVSTRWLRIRWNNVVAFGIGFDPSALIFGIYIGPIGIYLGDSAQGTE